MFLLCSLLMWSFRLYGKWDKHPIPMVSATALWKIQVAGVSCYHALTSVASEFALQVLIRLSCDTPYFVLLCTTYHVYTTLSEGIDHGLVSPAWFAVKITFLWHFCMTGLLIGWQRSRQPIRGHVRKRSSTDSEFNRETCLFALRVCDVLHMFKFKHAGIAVHNCMLMYFG